MTFFFFLIGLLESGADQMKGTSSVYNSTEI